MEKNIIQIDALPQLKRKLRVAAYARVSSAKDAMLHSLSAQVSYYNKYISSHDDWEFVGIYADEGISGTKEDRDEFQRMINDCRLGRIDLILTKAISRFARNTMTMLETVRELKSLNVDVFFEEQNLHSISSDGEMVLTLLASVAQEEARSVSENQKWRIRKDFEKGLIWGGNNAYGYRIVNKKMVLVPDEAKLVKRIFQLYIGGLGFQKISKLLNDEGIPAMRAKRWNKQSLQQIIANINYTGDLLLQKTYIADFLEHKSVKNNGEVAQAYVENNHPAIISREDRELVQAEMKKRQVVGAAYSANTIFSSRIKCEHCGSFYGRKVWHKGSPHEKQVFQCNGKYDKSHSQCKTPHFTEDEIKQKFMLAYNEAMTDKQRIIDDTKEVIALLSDTTEIEKRIADATTEIEIVAGLVEKLVQENASKIQDQDDYEARYQALTERYDKAKNELEKANDELLQKKARQKNLEAIVTKMEELDTVLLEWSDEIWLMLIEEAVAHENGTLTFKFKNGYNITK